MHKCIIFYCLQSHDQGPPTIWPCTKAINGPVNHPTQRRHPESLPLEKQTVHHTRTDTFHDSFPSASCIWNAITFMLPSPPTPLMTSNTLLCCGLGEPLPQLPYPPPPKHVRPSASTPPPHPLTSICLHPPPRPLTSICLHPPSPPPNAHLPPPPLPAP